MYNHDLIRFIKFVSQFKKNYAISFFISSRFNSPGRCRKYFFGILNFITKQDLKLDWSFLFFLGNLCENSLVFRSSGSLNMTESVLDGIYLPMGNSTWRTWRAALPDLSWESCEFLAFFFLLLYHVPPLLLRESKRRRSSSSGGLYLLYLLPWITHLLSLLSVRIELMV